jgi:ribosomal protein S21
MRKNNKFNNRRQRPLEPCVAVHAEECNGDPEKMVRRFTKKVKREGIIEECRDRRHFKAPSETNRERKEAKKRIITQVNRRRNELLTPRDRYRRKKR